MNEQRERLAHKAATWVGVVALLVAILIPVGNYLFDATLAREWSYLTGGLGILFAGSKRVTDTVTAWIEAWRGNS